MQPTAYVIRSTTLIFTQIALYQLEPTLNKKIIT
jgi:hypothetical protein